LKSLLSIEPDEYVLYGHFKDRIIKKAQKDLMEHTDIYFDFEEEAEKKKVYAITFFIYENKKNQRLKAETVESGIDDKVTIKQTETIENDELINSIYEKVSKYVSKLQVKKWIKEVSVEQIEAGITYTINYIQAGNEVGNIGGFLNTMVHTPNLYDKFETKKTKAKKATKKQQNTSGQIEIKKVELEQVQAELAVKLKEIENTLLTQNSALLETLITKIQSNQFYDHKKNLEENLQRDTIIGLRGAILQEMFPEYKALVGYFDNRLKVIRDELYGLGYKD
jgi:hypothetical protein